ncbi:hypothetical protein cypCar_00012745, partial [Cyprinus carpio]
LLLQLNLFHLILSLNLLSWRGIGLPLPLNPSLLTPSPQRARCSAR